MIIDEGDALKPLLSELISLGLLEPLDLASAEDRRRWEDADLASLVEVRLGRVIDAHAVDDANRVEARALVSMEGSLSIRGRLSFETLFWLRQGPSRVGTVAVAKGLWGGPLVRISSLYVYPDFRHGGIARRTLQCLRKRFASAGYGLKLETTWTSEQLVRFYLRQGFWVRMWKRDLDLVWYPGDPDYHITITSDAASLSVVYEGTSVTLARAPRAGERLILPPAMHPSENALEQVWYLAQGTLFLHLALAGWPLIRSAEDWESSHFADAGAPESLAYKITLWEAWHQKHGWRIDAPRVPGLTYKTWSEFE